MKDNTPNPQRKWYSAIFIEHANTIESTNSSTKCPQHRIIHFIYPFQMSLCLGHLVSTHSPHFCQSALLQTSSRHHRTCTLCDEEGKVARYCGDGGFG